MFPVSDDLAIVTKSAFVHYGSMDDRSAIEKRPNETNTRKAVTEQRLINDDDVCHAAKSKKSFASRAQNKAPKTKPSAQNISHQLSVSNGTDTSADVPNETCNSAVADNITASTGSGRGTGEVTDRLTTKCSSIPNGNRMIIQCKGDCGFCCDTNDCTQVLTLDGPRFAGSSHNNCPEDQECIPSICDDPSIASPSPPPPHPQLLIDLSKL